MSAAATPVAIPATPSASGPGSGAAAGKVDALASLINRNVSHCIGDPNHECHTPTPLASWLGRFCRMENGEYIYNGEGHPRDQLLEAESRFVKSNDGRKLFAKIEGDVVVITILVPPQNGAPLLPRAGALPTSP